MNNSDFTLQFTKAEFLDLADKMTGIANGTIDKAGIKITDPSSGLSFYCTVVDENSESYKQSMLDLEAAKKAKEAGVDLVTVRAIRALAELANTPFSQAVEKYLASHDSENDSE